MRTRLITLWLMLAASAVVTGYLLLEFYRQSANAQVARAEDQAMHACRDIADDYARSVGNRGNASGGNDILRTRLVPVVQAALAHAPGRVESGRPAPAHSPTRFPPMRERGQRPTFRSLKQTALAR